MRKSFAIVAIGLFAAACAPQTIISNQQQAVIEASSATDAVALATKECAKFDRWPLLQRHGGLDYWFACNESDETAARRVKAQQEAAMRQAEDLRKAAVAMPAPAAPSASAQPTALALKAEEGTARPSDMDKAAKAKRPREAKSTAKGNWVQLGAFRDKTVAEKYVAEIRKAHAGVVDGHDVVMSEAKSRTRGTLHLARLGPYPKLTDARSACARLKSGGAACIVVAGR